MSLARQLVAKNESVIRNNTIKQNALPSGTAPTPLGLPIMKNDWPLLVASVVSGLETYSEYPRPAAQTTVGTPKQFPQCHGVCTCVITLA